MESESHSDSDNDNLGIWNAHFVQSLIFFLCYIRKVVSNLYSLHNIMITGSKLETVIYILYLFIFSCFDPSFQNAIDLN